MSLTRKWLTIAKTEFYVQTSRFRRFRMYASISLLVVGIIWALYIVPNIITIILDTMGPEIGVLLIVSFPSLMRSAMLFLWILFLVYPISYALQEIRIGQWEIMLSNNVSTRDMMFGMFLGKVPIYGLLVVFAAPVILSPFVLALQVSLLGQIIMYLTVFFVALSTLFLSTLVSTAIQAKLGESSRGNDIAKALSMVVAIVILIPMYGLIYFSNAMSAILGMDVFILFPFTWGADIISWSIIIFNGLGLSEALFIDALTLTALGDFIILLCFTTLIVFLAYVSADRIFSFGSGPRTEKITTVGDENLFLKWIRRGYPGPSGVLVVNSIKEFTRKMQNVSRLAYGVAISILLPIILKFSVGSMPEDAPPDVGSIILLIIVLIQGMMLAMMGGITFGGIGFLESKDQLWIIKSAPNGVKKFGKARLTESFLLAIPMAIIPTTISAIVFSLGILESLSMIAYAYWSIIGAILFTTGITANNPAYEDQKSSAFQINTFVSVFGVTGIIMGSLITCFQFLTLTSNIIYYMIIMGAPLIVIGLVVYMIGITRMARVDTK